MSNKREAKYVERLRRELAVPSPDSGPSSPFPRQTVHQPTGGQKARLKCGSQGQVDSVSLHCYVNQERFLIVAHTLQYIVLIKALSKSKLVDL